MLRKKYWILISLIAVLLVGTLTYFGWIKQKSEPASSQPGQIKQELIREMIIPSSLESTEVMTQFVPYMPPWGEVVTKDDAFWWPIGFGVRSPHKGFAGGFSATWHGAAYWIKKDGTKVEGAEVKRANDTYNFILEIAVLKYEKPEYAQEDYDRISTNQEFKDLTINGVKLKTRAGVNPRMRTEVVIRNIPEMKKLKEEQCQQYLLHSNNFVVYIWGLKKAAEDAIIRLIDQYTVE